MTSSLEMKYNCRKADAEYSQKPQSSRTSAPTLIFAFFNPEQRLQEVLFFLLSPSLQVATLIFCIGV